MLPQIGSPYHLITSDIHLHYFCYLCGSEGYRRESYEPSWVTQIINNVDANKIESKRKLGNINCDSTVWKISLNDFR